MRADKIDSFLHRCAGVGSILYLALPAILFFLGWLRPFFAIVAISALCVGIFFYIKRSTISHIPFSFVKNKLVLIFTIVIMVIWTLIAGIGILGENHQTSDFNKHNAILADLTTHHWPVTYERESGDKTLVYYIAYYLPAAAIGKVFHSTQIAEVALLPWTVFGLILVMYWIFRILKRVNVGVVVLFIVFAGVDILGQLILRTSDTSVPILNIFSLMEGYASIIGANYQGNTSLLFWAPQHAVAAWLVAGMVLSALLERSYKVPILFVISLAVLWSPMVVVGTIPLLVAYVILALREHRLITILHPANTLIPLLFLVMFGLYFMSGTSDQVFHLITQHSNAPGIEKLTAYIVFIFLEFLIYILIARSYIKKLSLEWKTIIQCCVIFLCIIPFFIYGSLNDIGLRAPIISLFVVFLVVTKYLYQSPKTAPVVQRSFLLIAIISLGSISSLVEFNTHITGSTGDTHYWGSINSPNLDDKDAYFAKQYLGDPNSLFSRTIGKTR